MTTRSPMGVPSGGDLRRLLTLRRRLREEIVGLPKVWQREVLRALEEGRQYRLHGRTVRWSPPEMSTAELIREIKWRVDTAGLAETAAGVRALDRARWACAARASRLAGRERSR